MLIAACGKQNGSCCTILIRWQSLLHSCSVLFFSLLWNCHHCRKKEKEEKKIKAKRLVSDFTEGFFTYKWRNTLGSLPNHCLLSVVQNALALSSDMCATCHSQQRCGTFLAQYCFMRKCICVWYFESIPDTLILIWSTTYGQHMTIYWRSDRYKHVRDRFEIPDGCIICPLWEKFMRKVDRECVFWVSFVSLFVFLIFCPFVCSYNRK